MKGTKWMSSDGKCRDGATSIGLKLRILLAKYQVGEKNAVGIWRRGKWIWLVSLDEGKVEEEDTGS